MRRVIALSILIFFGSLLGSACVKRVTIPEFLPPQPALSTDDLVTRINAYSDIKSFSAQADVYTTNFVTDKANKAEIYPATTGLIRLRRPENIRMRMSFYGKQLADMVSDGGKFRLAIFYPEDKRRFIFGSSLHGYDHIDAKDLQANIDPDVKRAGGLVNMRPQHITDAYLIQPIKQDERTSVFREEVRQIEADTRPGRKGRSVEKVYYVLYVVERGDRHGSLRRKFWFDRSQVGTPLTRQQTYENGGGKLASDVTYSGWFKVENSDYVWPRHVRLERRNDGYALQFDLSRDSVEINTEMGDQVFELENTEKLQELDLDAQRKDQDTPSSKQRPPSNK